MQPTNAALRVVLGVAETVQIDLMRNKTMWLMKAYHFQQTIQQFCKYVLNMEEHGRHTRVLFLDFEYVLYKDALIVEPTLGSSFVLDAPVTRSVPLGDVEQLAEYFAKKPQMFDVFMNTMKRSDGLPGLPNANWNRRGIRDDAVCFSMDAASSC